MLKKKILITILMVSIFGLCSCGSNSDVKNNDTNNSNIVGGSAITIESTKDKNEQNNDDLKQKTSETDEENKTKNEFTNLESNEKEDMIKDDKELINETFPLLNSIILCMYENNYEYNIKSDEFVWNSLLYLTNNYNQKYEDMKVDDNYCKINEEVLKKIIKNIGLNNLPEISQNIKFIKKKNDTYSFVLNNDNVQKMELISFSKNIDNSFDVECKLVDEKTNNNICKAYFRLEPIENAFFPFKITQCSIEKNIGDILSGQIGEFEDSHTISIKIKGETKLFQVENDNIKKTLENKNIGDYIDFVVQNDTIISILN